MNKQVEQVKYLWDLLPIGVAIPAVVISLALFILVWAYIVYPTLRDGWKQHKSDREHQIILFIVALGPLAAFLGIFGPVEWGVLWASITASVALGSLIALNLRGHWVQKANESTDYLWVSDRTYNWLKEAKHSIVLVQTWFPDASVLGEHLLQLDEKIVRTKDDPNGAIDVEIYLLKPDTTEAIVRYGMLYGRVIRGDNAAYAKYHQEHFHCSIEDFILRLDSTRNMNIKILAYSHPPDRKIYLTDSREALHGTYSATRIPSTRGVAELVKSNSREAEEQRKFSTLLNYVQDLRNGVHGTAAAIPIYTKEPGEVPGKLHNWRVPLATQSTH